MVTRHTVQRDLELLARWVERVGRHWDEPSDARRLASELRNPKSAETFIFHVHLLVEDESLRGAERAAAERLQTLIDTLTETQLAALLAA
jgi:hypothetical protein